MPFNRNDRLLFDRSAADYDVARPGYPERLIEELVARSGIPDGGRILEIGCGTGQLTVLLAAGGYTITAVELGRELSRLATMKLESFPNTTVVCADFERWDVEPGGADLVVSAQAFHWMIRRSGTRRRTPRCARADVCRSSGTSSRGATPRSTKLSTTFTGRSLRS